MNFYKLTYIKNISRFDTWRFLSRESQYQYFNDIQGYRVDDYYPPHYTNSIRFDINDVDYSKGKYNYVLLFFNDKYYCYFIDDIEYINEDVYELKITMDTIQTYMFDIAFPYATLNRYSIKRWNDISNNTVNRSYQRENLSKEDFVKEGYQEVSSDGYGILIQATRVAKDIPQGEDYATMLNINGALFTTGFEYVYVPFPFGLSSLDVNYFVVKMNLYSSGGVSKGTINLTNLNIKDLIESPYVNNIRVVNDYFINKYIIVNYVGEQTTTLTDGTKFVIVEYNIYERNDTIIYRGSIGENFGTTGGVYLNSIDVDFNSSDYTMPFAFRPNTEIEKPFSKDYIPALLDENYIHIYYGEKVNYTTFPLSKSTKVTFKAYDYYDIFSGERSYKLLPTGENNDNYNTTLRISSIEEYELFNDAWKNYESQNKASLTMGRALSPIKTALGIGGNAATFEISRFGFRDIKKTGDLSNKGARALSSPIAYAASAVLEETSNQLNYLETRENLEHTPDTVKQGNNYSSDILDKSIKVIKYSEMVKDIDNVAKLLEQFGYNVDLTYNDTNLFNLNVRYYYNIIRCSSIKIDCLGGIIPEWIKQDICNRFMSGLRLWNKNRNIDILDSIEYDNVENDFIQ